MKQNKTSIFSMVMVAAVCYCGVLGLLLTVSISTGVAPEQSEVKVNISSFKLPENKELEIEKIEEITEAEAQAEKMLENVKSTENVDNKKEAIESVENSSLNDLAADVSKFTDIKRLFSIRFAYKSYIVQRNISQVYMFCRTYVLCIT